MNKERPKTLVIALGGNAMPMANEKRTVEEQCSNLQRCGKQGIEWLANENRVVISHGNGPQVGNQLLAIESARNLVPLTPLDICGTVI